MTKSPASADLVTELILEVFRLNGRLLAAGDDLVADIGLTSARWQVLGAVAYSSAPDSVSGLARGMGLTRQAVQRVVNDLVDLGLLALGPNPNHQRAPLVLFTPKGRAAYDQAADRQGPWAERLCEGVARADLELALRLLRDLGERLA